MQQTTRILIIEDDVVLSDLVAGLLREHGYLVRQCFDGVSGLATARKESFHLVLLDVLLPEMQGFEVLDRLRRRSDVPVMMITAKGAEADRITGFKTGADDYLPKPFNIEELLLRVEVIIKRTQHVPQVTAARQPQVIRFGELGIDMELSRAELAGVELDFTDMEFKLLAQLVENQGQVLSKPYLYHELMGRPYSRDERSLDVHVSKLRRKLTAAGFNGRQIRTVHGQGYCLK
ncbi:MAG: response regulator transcription factor [Amphritea sp.]|nr:response regulator transcription factor [Amphritea sp.]